MITDIVILALEISAALIFTDTPTLHPTRPPGRRPNNKNSSLKNNQSTSLSRNDHFPWLVLKRPRVAGFQAPGDKTIIDEPQNLQYRFQNIVTALYANMGGISWTIDHGETADDEIVIGIGTAELSGGRFESRQRHVGITTVLRGDGNYLLSNLSRECSYEGYPDVLRE